MRSKLIYIDAESAGYFRKKRGRGFMYIDNHQKKIQDIKTLKRIESLVIPPNWQDVWICEKENGHLQATGVDDKNRKQYIYHPLWTDFRQQTKFARMAEFGKALPIIRSHTAKDIKSKKWDKKKVLALVIEIMDEFNLRIGNEYYRDVNGTYGVSNLRRKHMSEVGWHLELDFKAKSGKHRHIEVEDRELVKLIKECSELPGYELFKYKGEDSKMHAIDSQDVNDYLKEVSGKEFSSKDFRTWNASVLAIEHYVSSKEEICTNPKLKFKSTLIKKVAVDMGNTPAVCENYYIHPHILKSVCGEEYCLPKVKELPAKYRKMKLEAKEKIALYYIENAPKIDEKSFKQMQSIMP